MTSLPSFGLLAAALADRYAIERELGRGAAQWLQEPGDLEWAARLLRYQDEPDRDWSWLIRGALSGPTYLARARIEERRGNSALALEYYKQFLRRYDAPIPALRSMVEEARDARARLAVSENRS